MQLGPEFQLIPVIDLKDGVVVRARAGKRDAYQAIHKHSNIVKESTIESVVTAFKQLFPFKTFYIADLNAITKTGHHFELIATTLAKYRDNEFWIDDGEQQGHYSYNSSNYKSVIGTEAQESNIQAMKSDEILSLDFMLGKQLGPSSWFNNHSLWPNRIMIMNLDHVGGQCGPDLNKLSEYVNNFPGKKIYAAGGVRNYQDLYQLQDIGVSGVLLASALHEGHINFEKL